MTSEQDKKEQHERERAYAIGRDLADKSATLVISDDSLGRCKSCSHLVYAKTKYNKRFACCEGNSDNNMRVPLKYGDPVCECTMYSQKGLMSLFEMKDIAILIEAKREKKVGF